jgi:Kef-type K+ transport system membrane component KefB
MHGVALLLFAAALAHLLARRLGVPPIPVLIVAGLVAARLVPPDPDVVEDVLVLGVSFMLFLTGLELDPKRMRAQLPAAIRVGTVHFCVLMAGAFFAALVLGFGTRGSAYLAVALGTSSTLVGVRLLQNRRQMYEPFGRLVLGVLLLQDLLVLASIPALAAIGTGWEAALIGLGGVALLAGLTVLVRAWVAPRLLIVSDDPELVLLAPLTLLFAFLALGSWLALPTVVGAFFAGIALARFPVNGVVRIELAPLGDFFTPLFFTALGALVLPPSLDQLLDAIVLSLVVILVTVPLVAMLAERAGFAAKSAIEAGLLLSQTSEISLVIGLAGMLQGDIDRGTFTVIILVTVGTMLLTPFLATDRVAWWLMRWHPAGRRPADAITGDGHVLLLGAGSTGMQLLEDLVIAGSDLVVVDDDPAVLGRLREAGIRTVLGDAADRNVMRQAGADRARVVISTIRRPRDNRGLLKIARGVPALVRVFDEVDATWVKNRGGIPVIYTQASADALIEWLDESDAELTARATARGIAQRSGAPTA